MGSLSLKNLASRMFYIFILSIFCIGHAYASTSGNMPFNTQISNFETSLISFVFVASVILFLVTCVLLAFDHDMTGNMKKIINIFSGCPWVVLVLRV